MSDNEKLNDTEAANTQPAEAAKQIAGNTLTKLLELKQSNPKVFFGAIGGVAVVLLVLMFSGGSSNKPKLPTHQNKDIAVGQSYVLKSPNAYDQNATIRLVSVPGSMEAYDDTEDADRNSPCKHLPQGTRVKAKQVQGGGNKGTFVQVEMLDGECAGKDGWTLAINVQ